MVVRDCRDWVKFMCSLAWVPRCEMSPEAVVGSPYSPPAVWNVSRQRPMLGRSTSWTISQAEDQVEAWVAQHLGARSVRAVSVKIGWRYKVKIMKCK